MYLPSSFIDGARHDVELAVGAVVVGRARHRHRAANVRQRVEFGLDVGQLRPALAGPGRVAALSHEAVDHAVEHRAVVEMLAGQGLDPLDVLRARRRGACTIVTRPPVDRSRTRTLSSVTGGGGGGAGDLRERRLAATTPRSPPRMTAINYPHRVPHALSRPFAHSPASPVAPLNASAAVDPRRRGRRRRRRSRGVTNLRISPS